MRQLVRRLVQDDRGATAIEYGLIVALVFLVAVGAINDFANASNTMYQKITTALTASFK